MSRPQQIVCDGCGKVKQESNRWWIIGITPRDAMGQGGTILVATADNEKWDIRFRRTRLRRTRRNSSPMIKLLDFCGEDCALKCISEQMGKA